MVHIFFKKKKLFKEKVTPAGALLPFQIISIC